MTYRIEITADSINELAGKLTALGLQLSLAQGSVTATYGHNDAAASTQVLLDEQAKVQAQQAPQSAAPTPAIDTTAQTGQPEQRDPEASLSYEKDVAPLVIALVGAKGKPAAMTVLEAFGATNAKEIPAEQWPALIEALNEAKGA